MRGFVRRSVLLAVLAALLLFIGSSAFAQETPEQTSEPNQSTNQLGAEVYTATCAACHGSEGLGIPGAFPPLADNPHVDDAAYAEQVIRGGRDGEIVVAGQTYNGVMPAFGSLTDDEVAAVIAYVQEDLGRPIEVVATPSPGSEAPSGVSTVWKMWIWLVVVAGLFVAIPKILAHNEGDTFTWGSAWLRAGVIVVFFAVATVWLPSAIIQSGPVASASRVVQDLVASGVWIVALGAGLYGLWWAQRDNRI